MNNLGLFQNGDNHYILLIQYMTIANSSKYVALIIHLFNTYSLFCGPLYFL